MITLFIQSADSRVNNQPIRYLFNGITLEMNLTNIKALKRVHWISWLITAEPKGLNKINWKAKKAIGQLRRYNILVIYLQSEELAETCVPSVVVNILSQFMVTELQRSGSFQLIVLKAI